MGQQSVNFLQLQRQNMGLQPIVTMEMVANCGGYQLQQPYQQQQQQGVGLAAVPEQCNDDVNEVDDFLDLLPDDMLGGPGMDMSLAGLEGLPDSMSYPTVLPMPGENMGMGGEQYQGFL